jgi:hypothetical protein
MSENNIRESVEVKEALESIKKAREALIPAIRNRHFLGGIKPQKCMEIPLGNGMNLFQAESPYFLVLKVESILDHLIAELEGK